MAVWLVVQCERCDGSGWQYCWKCQGICQHDRVCPMCAGYGEVPKKQTGVMTFVVQTFEHFSTKKVALQWIQLD